jgi:hypothetical protein
VKNVLGSGQSSLVSSQIKQTDYKVISAPTEKKTEPRQSLLEQKLGQISASKD